MSRFSSATTRKTSTERGYNWTWRKARRIFLAENPLCRMCLDDGRETAATVVDHRVPHLGNETLFWDTANWQALCKLHHDSTKQREEKTGREIGCGDDGWPVDPAHHWNKGGE